MSANAKTENSPTGLEEEMRNASLEGHDMDVTVRANDGDNNNWMGAAVGNTVADPVVAGANVAGAADASRRTDQVGTGTAAPSAGPVSAENPEGEGTAALSAQPDPSKTSTPKPKRPRGTRGGKGQKGKSGASPRALSPEKEKNPQAGGSKKKEVEKESWAEVAARGFPTLLLENNNRGMEHEDYLEFSQQLIDWQIEEDTTYLQSSILQSGLREGGISLVFKYQEGVQWFKDQVANMTALKEGDAGYKVYGPGEKPYTLFSVYTSDTKAVLKKDRFVGVLWKNNPDLHKHNTVQGEIKVLGGFPLKTKPGMKVKVAITNSLVQNLAEMRPRPYELLYAGGFLKFRQLGKKKAKVTGQAQDDDGDVEVVDLSDDKDEALVGDFFDPNFDMLEDSDSEGDA